MDFEYAEPKSRPFRDWSGKQQCSRPRRPQKADIHKAEQSLQIREARS
jgi:hypothetical protein